MHGRSQTLTERPLRGWKEIAAFLGTSSRSAQRWEEELGMPIYRLRGTTGSVVSAYPSELDAWQRSRAADLDRERSPATGDAEADLGEQARGGTIRHPTDAAPESGKSRFADRPGRKTSRWMVPTLGAVLVVLLGAGWFWLRESARETRPNALHAARGGLLRVTTGSFAVAIRPEAGKLATLTFAGMPELLMRTTPSGSELTVELYPRVATGASPPSAARLALVRLTAEVPGEVILAGGTRLLFTWVDVFPPHR